MVGDPPFPLASNRKGKSGSLNMPHDAASPEASSSLRGIDFCQRGLGIYHGHCSLGNNVGSVSYWAHTGLRVGLKAARPFRSVPFTPGVVPPSQIFHWIRAELGLNDRKIQPWR